MIERNILPADPSPTRYKLSIKPNLRNSTFDGNLVINLATAEEQDEACKINAITLNAAELTFHQVSFRCARSGQQLPISVDRITFDAVNQRATIPIPAAYTQPTELTIKYTGVIQSNMTGLYKSTYTISDKNEEQQKDTEEHKSKETEKEEVMLVTQMCPVDARKVFPCWDEPARKAIFEVSLIAPTQMIALSNMPCVSRLVRNDNTIEWHFAPTPPMSTYLLAFVMGKLSYIERSVKKTFPVKATDETNQNNCNKIKTTNTTNEETNVRVYAIPGKEHNAQFALDIACAVLPMYEEFFHSNYQLPKMDMIATPNFAFGAMENWGCITYRERLLLYSNLSGSERKLDCAITVAHEIAHQWFGNLVTMEWWKELWLNESFATFIATWAIHKLHPYWEMDVNYLLTECERAFELDALRSSHPIEVDLRNAQEIDGIFDAISYSKGGSVLRMVEKYIGADAFQRGLALYLQQHAFHNASTTDLWDALSSVHGSDLRSMLRCWTSQQGFPFLEVTLDTDNNADHNTCLTLHIAQSRFTLEKENVQNDSNELLWHIPLVITIGHSSANKNEKDYEGRDNDNAVVCGDATDGKEDRENVEEQSCSTNTTLEAVSTIRHVLPPSSQSSITLPHTNYSWINVNTRRTAFCRVFYRDHALLSLLLQKVQSKELDAMDRLTLVSDYHAFARGGYCHTSTVFEMLTYYVKEENLTVWKEITQFLNTIRYMLVASHSNDSDVLACFNKFCMHLYKPVMDRIGYPAVVTTSDASATSNTTELADEKINTNILRSVIVRSMLSVNDPETLQKMKEMSMNKNESQFPKDLISAVCRYKLEHGGESEFAYVLHEIKHTSDSGRKTMLLELLPSSNVENIVERLVDYVLSDDCQGQDALFIFNGLAYNPQTYIKFMHEMIRRWPEIAQKLPGVMQGRTLKLIGYGFDGSIGPSLRSFWSTLPETTRSSTGASFEQGMESLTINAAWAERDELDVAKFLQQCCNKE